MRKKWLVLGVVMLAAAVVALAAFAVRGSGGSPPPAASPQRGRTAATFPDGGRVTTRITDTFKDVSACGVFTLADARTVLGDEAEAETGNGNGSVENGGVALSSCGYALGAENVNDIIRVSVMVRAAKNKTGAITNENEFSALKAGGSAAVGGYGDAALWNQQMSQLHIKVDNNWYIISNVKGSRPGTGTLKQSKAVADQIISKL